MASDKKLLRQAAEALEKIMEHSLHAYASNADQQAIMHGGRIAKKIRASQRASK